MHTQLNTLIHLNYVSLDLDMVQEWIYGARIAAPTNPRVQAELDRQQDMLDAKRAAINLTMLDIACRN